METYRYTGLDNNSKYVAVCCGKVVAIKSDDHKKNLEFRDRQFKWSQKEIIKHKNTPTDSIFLPTWIKSLRKNGNS